MTTFKTLRHKTLPDTYGTLMRVGDTYELGHTSVPVLQPSTATKEGMIEYYSQWGMEKAIEQLEDYSLTTVGIVLEP